MTDKELMKLLELQERMERTLRWYVETYAHCCPACFDRYDEPPDMVLRDGVLTCPSCGYEEGGEVT